jgi:hypothetical protein
MQDIFSMTVTVPGILHKLYFNSTAQQQEEHFVNALKYLQKAPVVAKKIAPTKAAWYTLN